MSNAPAVQAIYQAFGTGNIPAILDHLADDVEWEQGTMDHGVPWLKPGRGKAHVLKFFDIIGRDIEISRFEVKNLFESGLQVIAHIVVHATYRPTGKVVKDDWELHVWTFGAGGKVASFRHVVDTHQHVQAKKR